MLNDVMSGIMINSEQRRAWRTWCVTESYADETMADHYYSYAKLLHERLCDALDALEAVEAKLAVTEVGRIATNDRLYKKVEIRFSLDGQEYKECLYVSHDDPDSAVDGLVQKYILHSICNYSWLIEGNIDKSGKNE